ncbi:uncharacterized protein JCM6883_007428 [Sporobolomyces salmoneus]|uniref:uncharacterized protein n=1 Tax=Sporobolomyces salmoneus TaxID=183962 RepID=UPI0031705CD1
MPVEEDRPPSPPPTYLQASSPQLDPNALPTLSVPPSVARPPPRTDVFDHAWSQLNLPMGMFLLKNVATGKTLDLLGHKAHEGASFGVHPVKQPTLKGLSLQHLNNNQLFFIDWNGHLQSAAVSRAIDIVDDQLSLAFPHPIQTYPSLQSHPPPRFFLHPKTSTLELLFDHDPDFPPPLHPSTGRSTYQEYDYLIEVVPLQSRTGQKGKASLASTGNEIVEKAGKAVFDSIGLLSNLYPFSSSSSTNPVTIPTHEDARAKEEEASTGLATEKRLPRNRDASLPPPPIPSKSHEDEDSPVSTPPVSPLSRKPPHSALPESETPPSQLNNFSPSQARDEQRADEQSDNESNTEEEDSDDEPTAFRPVRIVKLLKSSNWRETEFPFNISPLSKDHKEEEEEEEDSVGLGLKDGSTAQTENVWPESLPSTQPDHRPREPSFASTSSTLNQSLAALSSASVEQPAAENEKESRRKRREEMKEIRKWRRRQWEAIPVRVEPVPMSDGGGGSGSWRVQHELEVDMYEFRGGASSAGHELEREEEEGLPDSRVPPTIPKRGSIGTAVTAGVGSFFNTTSRLFFPTSSTATSALPQTEEDETIGDDDEQDAQEVGSDELEKMGRGGRRRN